MLSKIGAQIACIALCLCSGAMIAGGQVRDDLSRALSAGVGRVVTAAPRRDSVSWREIGRDATEGEATIRNPRSICWLGQLLVVADGSTQRLVMYGAGGSYAGSIGSRGTSSGQFSALSVVRCGRGKVSILAGDLGNHRLSFFDSTGRLLRTTATPEVPQIDILGELALATNGSWFESWLGADGPFGPYLSDEEWRVVKLVRRYGPDDKLLASFGTPLAYEDPVARRVLNKVSFAQWRDTLWTLTQGDATIRGATASGAPTARPVRLPVYFRGAEPSIELGEGRPGSPFIPNSMTYEPNVADLTIVSDSLFAVIRYRDWGMRMVGPGLDVSLRHIADSSIELVDRRGRVVRSLDAPGFVLAVEADGYSRLAILTQFKDRSKHVLVTQLPR